MSIINKVNFYEKKGLGEVAVVSMRLPFRAFSKNPYKMLFRPEFDGAKWYTLEVEKIDPIKLFASASPYTAMAYLRSVQEL